MISKPKAAAAGWAMRMTLQRDFAQVRFVSGRVKRFLREHGCGDDTRADFELALVEACNNAIKHTSCAAREPVIIELSVRRSEIELRVIDHGDGFSWPGNIELPSPENENGRGLYLIRRLMDSVQYERGNGRNALVLRKKRRRARLREAGSAS